MSSEALKNLESDDRKIRLEAIKSLEISNDDKIIYRLINHLADPFWPVREASAKRLLELGETVLAHLMDCLDSDNADIKFWAGWILGRIKTEASLELLVNAFKKSDDANINRNISIAIIESGKDAVPVLLKGCNSEEINVRLWSTWCLGQLKVPEGRQKLEELLKDPSWAVRRNSITALGQLHDRRSLELLINCLDDESWNVRMAATEALGSFKGMFHEGFGKQSQSYTQKNSADQDEMPELLLQKIQQALSDEDQAVKEAGITVLGNLGHPSAIKPMIAIFKEARSDELRKLVIHSLGKIKDDQIFTFFAETLKELESSPLRADILRTYLASPAQLSLEELERSLFSENTEEVKTAIDIAVLLDNHETLQLLSSLTSTPDNSLRNYLTEKLGELKQTDPSPYLYVLSEDFEAEIRKAALRSLSVRLGHEIIADIIEFLGDESELVQREALSILIRFSDRDALHPLLKILRSSETKNTKYMAIQALSAIGEAALPSLLKLLQNEDMDIRFWTIEALSTINHHDSTSALINLLTEENDIEIRNSILRSIKAMDAKVETSLLQNLSEQPGIATADLIEIAGRSSSREDLPFLRKFIDSKDHEVRFRAINSISRIDRLDDETLNQLINLLSDRHWPVRKAASDVLGKMGRKIYDKIIGIFTKERRHPDEIFWGIRTLGKLAIADSVPLLTAELDKPTTDETLRIEIVKSLGRVNCDQAQVKLLELLSSKDKNLRFHAAKGLKSASNPDWKPQLIKALGDEYENVRYWIAITLGNYKGADVIQALESVASDDSYWVRKYAKDSLDKITRLG